MTEQYFIRMMLNKGYHREWDRELYIFTRRAGQECYVVMVSDAAVSWNGIMRRRQELTAYYRAQGIEHVYHLYIMCRKDAMFPTEILQLTEKVPNFWIYTRDQRRFWQYEHQPVEFDGLNAELEKHQKRSWTDKLPFTARTAPWVTGTLIILNCFCFFYPVLTGNYSTWVENGMNSRTYVFGMHQWYRLFTSMFLHGGLEHLLNNMLVLLLMGVYLEPVLGKIKYLLIYIISGLVGSVLSCILWGGTTGSVGASGAIFGLSGAMLALVLFCRENVSQLSPRRVVFMCIASLYNGFTSVGVDNAAHIGGMAAGFVLVIITNKIHKKCI